MDILYIKDLYKKYGDVTVLNGLNLQVKKGELLSLLGPSGCGKTTLLRIIAGLTSATSGRVFVEGRDITELPPYKRNNGMVFQNYALFPHMTISENIEFGLKMHNIKKSDRKEMIQKGLSLIHMEQLGNRYPRELSGGQQQRVALVRALVLNPVLLLLDEPLCNLDAALRKEMRVEIRKIQQQLKITTIFVTHDQEEALAMSDRIAIIKDGRFEQIGTPEELYDRPATKFVASFIGASNILTRTVGDKVTTFSIRPEKAFLKSNGEERSVPCVVETKIYLGASYKFIVKDASGKEYTADVAINSDSSKFQEGSQAYFCWHKEDELLLSA
ncbi:MAG: Spermidine/putrescine import ATP-binding protein PotA [Succiniclasticum sp.]|jgi:putative spermidine/putrescine transport system ATP-binding protein